MSNPKLSEGDTMGYVAWGRGGSEHEGATPEEAARAAYYAKAPGRKRRAVLVMARKRGGRNFDGEPQSYVVPLGWWRDDE